MKALLTSLRLVVATMLICVAGYTGLILAFAQIVTPDTAEGSLIRNNEGKIIGSRLIAQKFEQPRYFWPRPSAAGKDGYDATAAAGSNKSPTSSDLADRGRSLVARHGATEDNPLPADLATASGGGLDPHIKENAARYQAERIAQARALTRSQVESLVEEHAFEPGGFLASDRIVNVLELNLALDAHAAPP
jgi:K+-transporting ATPase ATPase C chain